MIAGKTPAVGLFGGNALRHGTVWRQYDLALGAARDGQRA
eukprot:CAMPEP_0204526704 /NCGR_PEP_ID=MMETSP0661-20131031/8585_1 /ASSEMBLY_ACC=CAM_ASM_000606 /TAXON_ID=109239 /ORGANISM="Alexandrium margalefi, Strain AMGDE01CS-322" /LENGTH=39 /DNA_ID= /DNA_START= /DNA_END= /DNA_ORIENTATION=